MSRSILDPCSGVAHVPCPLCGVGTVPKPEEIGDALKVRRVDAGIGLRDMARRIGFKSSGYLSDLEQGKYTWTRAQIIRYEAALAEGGGGA